MEKFDLRPGSDHERVVDGSAREHRAHGNGAVGQPLSGRDEVRDHPKAVHCERRPQSAEPGDHLVEDQQDPVTVAKGSEPRQVTGRRRQHARRARNGLDDDRRDRLGAVQSHQRLQVVSQVRAMRRLAARETVATGVMRVAQMIGARQQRERPSVVHQTAHRDAAEAHAVVAPLTADEARARPLPDGPLIREGDLQGGVDGLRAGVGEEDPVETGGGPTGRDGGQPLGGLERDRVAHLERRREVALHQLTADGLRDLAAAMSGVHAPEARRSVQDLAPIGCGVAHAGGGAQQARRGLELPVARERHPEAVQRDTPCVRRRGHAVAPAAERPSRRASASSGYVGRCSFWNFS